MTMKMIIKFVKMPFLTEKARLLLNSIPGDDIQSFDGFRIALKRLNSFSVNTAKIN